jgi:hypothetical protein
MFILYIRYALQSIPSPDYYTSLEIAALIIDLNL